MTTSGPTSMALVNAVIVTVDAGFSVHEALLIEDGRIVAVGDSAAIRTRAREGTPVLDLHGRMVLPGFLDAHAHAVHRGIGDLASPSLAGCASVSAICAAVARAAAQAGSGEWIVTSPAGEPPDYFDLPEWFEERRWPTRRELDDAAPDNPVYIPTPAGWPYPAVLNSRALDALGVGGDRDDPTIRAELDAADGRPTGLVHGLSFYNGGSPTWQRLLGLLPRPTQAVLQDAIESAFEANLAAGITSVYECHANFNLAELRALRAAGRLRNRVVFTHEARPRDPVEEIERWCAGLAEARGAGSGDELLRVLGITVTLDGSTPFGKAHMLESYRGPDGQPTHGASSVTVQKLTQIAFAALDNDLRLNVLACGDAAIGITMEALRAAHARSDLRPRRWVLQHAQFPTREQIGELAAMGVVAQTCASGDYSRGAAVFRERLPGDLWERTIPMRWWFDGGVPIAQGSDGGDFDPLFHIWTTLRRQDARTGESLLTPAKQVSREEAIASLTRNGALVMHTDDLVGSLEPGKLADCVVLDRDILTCEVDLIRRTKVIATLLGGSVVYDPDRIFA